MLFRKSSLVPAILLFLSAILATAPASSRVRSKVADSLYSQTVRQNQTTRSILLSEEGAPVLWFLADSVLGRDFSFFTTVIETSFKPEKDAKFGYPGDRFGPLILRFVREGDEIVLQQVSSFVPDFQGNQAMLRLWEERYNSLELMRFPIVIETAGGLVTDVSQWLADDWFFGLQAYSFLLKIGPLKQRTGYPEVQRSPGQIIVRSDLDYSPIPIPGTSQQDSHWKIGTCLTLLPKDRMTPVYSDWRVGYFSAPAVREGEDSLTFDRARVIRKFRDGVTFHLYPGFPESLLPALRRAAQNWDRIFKDYGLGSGVELKEPTAAEMASGKYQIDDARLSWIKYNDAPYNENAYGRGYVDVRTGEVLCGCLGVFSGVDRNLRRWYVAQTGDLGPVPEDVYMAMFEMVATHEIGHILGLAHNFYGSRLYSTDQLKDASLMSKVSHGSTVMDYMRLNYAAEPQDGIAPVDLVPGIGPYDRAAIIWGYGKGFSHRRFAQRMFAVDSLRYLPESMTDPQTLAEDLGSDPFATAEIGMNRLRQICARISEGKVAVPANTDGIGQSAGMDDQASAIPELDTAFIMNAVIRQYQQYVSHAVSHIGGRQRVPDEKEGFIAVPVDSRTLNRALDFIERYVYNPPGWASGIVDKAYAERIHSMVQRRLDKGEPSEGGEKRPAWQTERGYDHRDVPWTSVLTHNPPTIANLMSGLFEMDNVFQTLGFRIISYGGVLFLLTEEPFELSVSAQIDRGAGLSARPLLSASAFSSGGLADLTGIFAGILSSEYVKSSYGLTLRYYPGMFTVLSSEPEMENGGWNVRLRVNYAYSPASDAVEMVPRSGILPVEVSFHIKGLALSGTDTLHNEEGTPELAGTDTIYVSGLVPEYYLRQMRRGLRRFQRLNPEQRLTMVVGEEITASEVVAVSFDVMETSVSSAPGLHRLNIGAMSPVSTFSDSFRRFLNDLKY